MKIVFMGTPGFAVESLKAIHEAGFEIVGVITAPDRASGRGLNIKQSEVKQYALEHSMNILQPTNLKDPNFISDLADLKADLQVVVAFRMLPEVVWNMPPKGSINLHASLLPNYRGAAPINWAIINGEKESGVSTFFLKHEIDTGDIIVQRSCKINSDETAGSLHDKLMLIGAEALIETLNHVKKNNIHGIPQQLSGKEKKAPKIFKDDCRINWNMPAIHIDQFIRGLNPYPTAWTKINNKTLRIKIGKATERSDLQIGELRLESGKVYVGCKEQCIQVSQLQIEGKKVMSGIEFANGYLNYNGHLLK